MKKTGWLFYTVLLLTLIIPSFAAAKTILYVPLDNRPVNYDYVLETGWSGDIDILAPPPEYLAGRYDPGDPDRLWSWVYSHYQEADAVVLAADAMLYGGLVPSRVHHYPEAALQQRLREFAKLRQLHPSTKLYVFSTVMRTPQTGGGEEPDYYATYGQTIFALTALLDKSEQQRLTKSERLTLDRLTAAIPPAVMTDWSDRRNKNFRGNSQLIQAVGDGQIDYLILGLDDCAPFSQSNREARLLIKQAQNLPAGKFISFPGADQLGMLLITRAINDLNFAIPIVAVHYTGGRGAKTVPAYENTEAGQTVNANIIAAGGIPLLAAVKPDLVLAVNTPENGITAEAGTSRNRVKASQALTEYVRTIETDLAAGRRVAIADIAFANGADNSLIRRLAEHGLLPELAAYSGWNTAGNTIGFAVGQGLLAPLMTTPAKNRLLAVRLLDDWAYQANVRGLLADKVLNSPKGDPSRLDKLTPELTTQAEKNLAQYARTYLPEFSIGQLQVSFPWNRLFEVMITTD